MKIGFLVKVFFEFLIGTKLGNFFSNRSASKRDSFIPENPLYISIGILGKRPLNFARWNNRRSGP